MNNSFNVLPSLVPTNFTSWSVMSSKFFIYIPQCHKFTSGGFERHKMFSSSKITCISSWSADVHSYLEVKAKRSINVILFPSFVPVFFKKWIWLEDSSSRWTYEVSHLRRQAWWCQKPWFVCAECLEFSLFEVHAFTIKRPCPSCFHENTWKAE